MITKAFQENKRLQHLSGFSSAMGVANLDVMTWVLVTVMWRTTLLPCLLDNQQLHRWVAVGTIALDKFLTIRFLFIT